MIRKTLTLTIAIVALLGATIVTRAQAAGSQSPAISPDEASLADKIKAAPDAATKLKAAAELIKKYPKTAIRGQVAQEIANRIQEVKDAPQKLALAQEFQATFNDPADDGTVAPVVLNALADANQFDQAFAKGADFLSRNPESLPVLVILLSIGTEQAKKRNPKFVDPSIRYANQIITLAEADKKPATVDHPTWQQFKTVTLPSIYQSLGLLYMVKGNPAEAKASYTRASQVAPSDAFNFVMIGAILNEEYKAAVTTYQAMPAGPEKDAQLKKVQAAMDAVIDAYAHAIALSEGNAALAQTRQQFLQDFEMYYKFRNNNSTAGMQQLIDKYKVVPKP
jgi:tetratricopeptide (TPR) repeat protein